MNTLKPSEFAKRIGVCLKTVQSWDNKGVFPAKRTPTGRRYYTQEDVDNYFKGGTKNGRENAFSQLHLEKILIERGIDYKGDTCWHLKNYPNLVLWAGWSLEFFTVLNDLLRENVIKLNHSNRTALCYLIDGKILPFPIAQKIMQYKSEHWVPVTFNKRGEEK